jgi:hypothetical protein
MTKPTTVRDCESERFMRALNKATSTPLKPGFIRFSDSYRTAARQFPEGSYILSKSPNFTVTLNLETDATVIFALYSSKRGSIRICNYLKEFTSPPASLASFKPFFGVKTDRFHDYQIDIQICTPKGTWIFNAPLAKSGLKFLNYGVADVKEVPFSDCLFKQPLDAISLADHIAQLRSEVGAIPLAALSLIPITAPTPTNEPPRPDPQDIDQLVQFLLDNPLPTPQPPSPPPQEISDLVQYLLDNSRQPTSETLSTDSTFSDEPNQHSHGGTP